MEESEEDSDSDLGLGDDSFEHPEWRPTEQGRLEDTASSEDGDDGGQVETTEGGPRRPSHRPAHALLSPTRSSEGPQRSAPKAALRRSEVLAPGEGLEWERSLFSRTGKLLGGGRPFLEEGGEAEDSLGRLASPNLAVSSPWRPLWGPEEGDFEGFSRAKSVYFWRRQAEIWRSRKNFGAGANGRK